MILKLRNIARIKTYPLKNKLNLIIELKKGEESGFVKNFNSKAFLKKLHKKYLTK